MRDVVNIFSELKPMDPTGLNCFANPQDLRRDLHIFIDYMRMRSVKRSVRGNAIPQADVKRLANLMHISAETRTRNDDDWDNSSSSGWVDDVDAIALRLGLVTYDTEGKYIGYSSNEPSFRENYIVVNDKPYQEFLQRSLAKQEQHLFDTLVNHYTYAANEFFEYSPMGILNHFSHFGSAIGIVPTLNFAEMRRFLFNILKECQPGVWYRTEDLIHFLKAHYPYALIPQKTPLDQYSKKPLSRYGNFHEKGYDPVGIPDDAPDAFERVEGRYVERFLENIPLTLGYVEVAYDPAGSQQEHKRDYTVTNVSRGMLVAFRITDRLVQSLNGTIPPPTITIQPNFEIYVSSAFYPATEIAQLAPYTEVVQTDATTILKLQKQKVTAQLASHPDLDVGDLLRQLSGKDLPQNVLIELEEWEGHAEVFTLFDGFGLVEGDGDLPAIEAATVERIGQRLRLVRQPEAVLQQLRAGDEVVIRIVHPDRALEQLPEKAQTIFPRHTPAPPRKKKEKPSLVVQREVLAQLRFPNAEVFAIFRKAFIDAHCLVAMDETQWTITVSGDYETPLKKVIKQLSTDYTIRLEEK